MSTKTETTVEFRDEERTLTRFKLSEEAQFGHDLAILLGLSESMQNWRPGMGFFFTREGNDIILALVTSALSRMATKLEVATLAREVLENSVVDDV